MRTREEQISALAFEIDGVQAKASTKRYVEQHLIEAERRAEQRVRAEIGRDSERLDWLAAMKVGVDFREEMGWGVYDIIEGILGEAPTIRDAIDAAREVG